MLETFEGHDLFGSTLISERMKTFGLLLILLSSINMVARAQEPADSIPFDFSKQNKNAIYADAGFWLLGGSLNLNYEHILKERKKGYFAIKGTYGRWLFWDAEGDLFRVTADFVHGAGNHHFEIDLGAILLIEVDYYSTTRRKWQGALPLPDLFAGYRFQRPEGHLLFKAGIGFPSLLEVGLGAAF